MVSVKTKNFDGQQFGKLTVITTYYSQPTKKDWACLAECECGVKKEICLTNLSRTTSCGAKSCRPPYKEGHYENLVGKTYGFLEVLEHIGKTRNNTQILKCLCLLCDNESKVASTKLKSGQTVSCGCYRDSLSRSGLNGYKHGYSLSHDEDPIYKRLTHMRDRCNKPTDKGYKNYGARGIQIWEHWDGLDLDSIRAFRNYILDIEPNALELFEKGYEIDRINNDWGYFPGNLRIVTQQENSTNKRNNIRVQYKGTWYCATHLYRDLKKQGYIIPGLEKFKKLLKEGYSVERIVNIGAA